MHDLTPVVLAASTVQAIGIVIAVIAMVGFVVYAAFNVQAGREEVGAELELAANLKPYYDDDDLETKKLDRTLTMGLATLAVIGIGLPAYWLAEPGRQDGSDRGVRAGLRLPRRGAVHRWRPVHQLPRQRRLGRRRPVHHPRRRQRVRGPGGVEGPGAQHGDAALQP